VACDAFDDSAWPTMKGGHHHPQPAPPAYIDPTHACAAQGRPFDCANVATDGTYTWEGDFLYYSVCVDGSWQCKPGKKRADECCWAGDPSCTPADGGGAARR
jgi:hypothetical protein